MRILPLLMTALLASPPTAALAGGRAAPAAVRDLAWGEVLYEHFQEEPFAALVRLAAAESRQELVHHGDDAALLRGGTYLSWGLRDRAERIFLSLLEQGTTPERRDQAWYWLARIRHERGEHPDAYAALERIGDALPEAFQPDRKELAGRVLIALGRYEEAVGRLSAAGYPGAWRAFADFNLAVALSRAGRDGEAQVLLERVGTVPASTDEMHLLRDRANLALGLARLDAGDAQGARRALDRVRLGGPFSGRALLAAGWAEARRGEFRAALGPWQRLATAPDVDGARLEALMAMPWAWHQLDAQGESVAGYETAVAACEAELARLVAARRAVAGEGLDSILRGGPGAADSPLGGYIHALAADYPFRAAVADLRDLDHMAENLSRWKRSLGAFRDMVEARRARFDGVVPQARELLADARLWRLVTRHEALSARVSELTARVDPAALASQAEKDQLGRILNAKDRAERLPEGPAREAALERVRRLEGAVAWRLHAAWPGRLRGLQKAEAQSRRLLDEARYRRSAVQEHLAAAPLGFDGYDERIDVQARRLDGLLDRVVRARERRLGELRALVLFDLDQRQGRVAGYLGEARFALAAAWDAAANRAAETGTAGGGTLPQGALP